MKKKILIVEDSPTQAMQLEMILNEHDYETEHRINGLEALEFINEGYEPDIVISDIVMPVMDGYELCTKLKEDESTAEIPVVLLTQLSDPNDVIKGLQANADNFISKPYTEEFLIERISDMLMNKMMRKRSPNLDISMEIFFAGQKHQLNSNRMQILDLLLSTYYNAINKNKELQEKNEELNRVHKELSMTNMQLKDSIEEKNHFLGIAAHDLRSPLCTVSSYLELISSLLPMGFFEKQEAIFSMVDQQLKYMLTLITDVLDYAKIESGTLDLSCEEMDIKPFMDKVISLNNMLGKDKNIKIESRYSDASIVVNADKNKLKQVMDNLISNSIKYSERNTAVGVYMYDRGDFVEVEVCDQGIGIPQEKLSQIFKPFSTVSGQGTEGEKSTGLGLVSVKKIVEAHGGEISAESEVGVGSKFIFTIAKASNGN